MQTQKQVHKNDTINVKRSWEVNFWCEEFNLRAEELKEIVKKVGPRVNDVRLYLAKKLLNTFSITY